MKKYAATGTVAAVSFIWTGMIMAISFMEAWLKFRAPGITLPLGLSIGRLVFNVLNSVEWVFCCVNAFILFIIRPVPSVKVYRFFIPCVLLLLLQSLWLLPALDARAERYIRNLTVSTSYTHFYYGIAEVLKCILLLYTGIKCLFIMGKQQ